MTDNTTDRLAGKVALVTGGARRIGAQLVRALHAQGATVAIHCQHSQCEAAALADALTAQRPHSATVVTGDLCAAEACSRIIETTTAQHGRLDIVVNNASTFYPTPVGAIDPAAFDDLIGSNLRAATFITQAATPALRASHGAIVNLADIHGERPLTGYSVYCAAKAGIVMLTQALAQELAPDVRVNAIAPGSILWPESADGDDPERRAQVLAATPLARQGTPDDIAAALLYLVADAGFVTGQVLRVDGGRGL